MTVRVRQVSADGRQFNVEMCRDIDKVAVHGRWPLTTGVAQGRYYCIELMYYVNRHKIKFLVSCVTLTCDFFTICKFVTNHPTVT